MGILIPREMIELPEDAGIVPRKRADGDACGEGHHP
jgi:hypothetical protein